MENSRGLAVIISPNPKLKWLNSKGKLNYRRVLPKIVRPLKENNGS